MSEEWRGIKGFPGYEVSDQGRVRSSKYGSWRILKSGGQRYLKVSLMQGVKDIDCNVHRLVLEAFVGCCPTGRETAHNNGDAQDNRAVNLRWTTRKDNHHDRDLHGTTARGSRHGNTKLDELQVAKIKALLASGYGCAEVGRAFGVSINLVWKIKNGDSWKHVAC